MALIRLQQSMVVSLLWDDQRPGSKGLMTDSIEANGAKPQFFYGWVIVALTFVIQFLVMGSAFYIFSVLLKPLAESLEADRFLVSLGLSSQMVVSALVGPWLGRAIGRYSIRLLMSSGIVLLSSGLLIVSQATELWHFYAGFTLVVSTGFALSGPIPNSALIANWFVTKRGSAMGISQFGVTFSGAVLVPLFTWLTLTWDWRFALLVFAGGVAVIALPLIFYGITKTPEEKGLHPDGAGEPPADEHSGEDQEPDWTLGRALKTPDIWKIAFIVGPGFMGISAVMLSIHSHMTDLGESEMRASSLVATMTLMGALAKPTFGILTDYLNKKMVILTSIALMFCGVSGILLTTDYYLLVIAAGMFGLGYGAQMPLFNIMVATIFSRRAFAQIIGLLGPIMLPFNLFGLPLTTFIYEQVGSYVPAYTLMLGLYVISIISLSLLKVEPKEG